MTNLLAGVLGALLATNQPAAVSNLLRQQTGVSVRTANPDDPVEKEYRKLMADDNEAQAEVDQWIIHEQEFKAKGAGVDPAAFRTRILQRFEPVRQGYADFLQRHPDHVNARIAYASFLSDIGEEEGGSQQLLKAREIDPANPAIWNNLGNYYGHNGGASNAFVCYTKAAELAPAQSLYYQNLAVLTYMFRQDALRFYGITEPQLRDKVMALYRQALALDPQNFGLAAELAQTYYGFKPLPSADAESRLRNEKKHYDEALQAWEAALKLARDDSEREGVYLHFARLNISAGRMDEARRYLTLVTNAVHETVKARLQKNMVSREAKAAGTNLPAPTAMPAVTNAAGTNAVAVPR